MENFNWLQGFIVPYINFLLFIVLAVIFFRKPLANMAKKRREDFKNNLKLASEAKEAADKKLAEINQRLSQLDQEIKQINERAETEAKKEAQKIIADAEKQAAFLVEEAKRISEAELSQAMIELQDQILHHVKEQLTKKIKSDFSRDQHSAYIQSHLTRLGEVSEGVRL